MLSNVEQPSDNELMLRFRDGDPRAFETLYRRHRGPLYRYFLRQADRAQADDLFQELWLKVVKGRARYVPSGSCVAYLYRIAHNVLVDHYRAARRPSELVETLGPDADDGAPWSETEYEAAVLRGMLAAAIDQLPCAQREVLMLHQETELSLEEIGRVVGVSRETVKSRLRYAVRRLRAALTSAEPALEKRA
jgi:RNA polymerase sigma-70 factor (ECF subfamily)